MLIVQIHRCWRYVRSSLALTTWLGLGLDPYPLNRVRVRVRPLSPNPNPKGSNPNPNPNLNPNPNKGMEKARNTQMMMSAAVANKQGHALRMTLTLIQILSLTLIQILSLTLIQILSLKRALLVLTPYNPSITLV